MVIETRGPIGCLPLNAYHSFRLGGMNRDPSYIAFEVHARCRGICNDSYDE